MPRSTKPRGPKEHVAVRLDKPTVDRIDALLPLYEQPWRGTCRSDALRALLLAGLEVEERRATQRTARSS